MARKGSLRDAFIDALRQTYDAERQLMKGLPALARVASNATLADAFTAQGAVGKQQICRLERVFRLLDERVGAKQCDGMEGTLDDGKALLDGEFTATPADACLILIAQRAHAYQGATYRSLIAWANRLPLADAAALIAQNLSEEDSADANLAQLSERLLASPEESVERRRSPVAKTKTSGR